LGEEQRHVFLYADDKEELDKKIAEHIKEGCRTVGETRKLKSGKLVQQIRRRWYVNQLIHNSPGFNK